MFTGLFYLVRQDCVGHGVTHLNRIYLGEVKPRISTSCRFRNVIYLERNVSSN